MSKHEVYSAVEAFQKHRHSFAATHLISPHVVVALHALGATFVIPCDHLTVISLTPAGGGNFLLAPCCCKTAAADCYCYCYYCYCYCYCSCSCCCCCCRHRAATHRLSYYVDATVLPTAAGALLLATAVAGPLVLTLHVSCSQLAISLLPLHCRCAVTLMLICCHPAH